MKKVLPFFLVLVFPAVAYAQTAEDYSDAKYYAEQQYSKAVKLYSSFDLDGEYSTLAQAWTDYSAVRGKMTPEDKMSGDALYAIIDGYLSDATDYDDVYDTKLAQAGAAIALGMTRASDMNYPGAYNACEDALDYGYDAEAAASDEYAYILLAQYNRDTLYFLISNYQKK